jgi:transposase
MDVQLSPEERAALATARAREGRARVWRRYRALELLDDGQAPGAVAKVLGCCLSSIYNWMVAWRRDGLVGLAERRHAGGPRRLAGAPEEQLDALLASDPQAAGYRASGWTAPLLRAELAKTGTAVSERTIRRALHRRGWRWKRPKYVLGRPDPAYAEKKSRWNGRSPQP